MSDPIFAAEMAALAAAHREREKGRIGDGMAAGSADPTRPAGWMDFSGPRVPVPSTREPWAPVSALRSEAHRHTGTSDCLETVAGGIQPASAGDIERPEAGWVKCSRNGIRYHLHGNRLMAHWSRDMAACPTGSSA